MQTRTTSVGLCWLVACSLSSAAAQDMLGSYDLAGSYSTGETTTATLRVTRTPDGSRQRTVREAVVDGQSIRWFSGPGRQVGERLYVIYEVGYDAGMSGAISGAASGSNRFLAMYRRSGTTLSETVVNLTREGPEAWSRLRTSGGEDALHRFRRAAHRERDSLARDVMEFRTDVLDYYEPGDEDRYRADSDAAEAAFASALWDDVAVPAGYSAAQALASHVLDPTEVVEPGRIILLFNDQASVTHVLYDFEGELYENDGSWQWPSTPVTPPPPGPGVNVNCGPGQGLTAAEAFAKVDAMDASLTRFVMDFRTNIADYYDWGDQAYYDADEKAAETYFRTATFREVPVPAGYTAHKAIQVVNSDPTDVILGTITVLLDCDGKRIDVVYDHEGEVYDEGDI